MDTFLKRIVWLVMIIPIVYLAIVWNSLPEKIAMQFNLNGDVRRWGSKKELIILTVILTVVSALAYLLVTNIYRIDPKKNAVENKSRLARMAFAISVFLAGVICMIIYNAISGSLKPNMGFIFAGIGLLFAFIGNYMHNIKPNYFAGLRLPWTLANEDNWKKTHALAGKLWFAGGLSIAVICMLVPVKIAIVVFIAVILIISIIPFVFSYRLYQKQKNNSPQ